MEIIVSIRPTTEADKELVEHLTRETWHSEIIVVHDTIYRPAELPGFFAQHDQEIAGLITYHIEGIMCEIISLESIKQGCGVGTALIEAVRQAAERAGCRRLWLVTSNDNLPALNFYQKRGFRLVRIDQGAVDRARKIKPQIPQIGLNGIPIQDEFELELVLDPFEK